MTGGASPATVPTPPPAQCLSPWGCRCRRVSRSLSRWSYAACPFGVEGAGFEVTLRPVGVSLGVPPVALPAGAEGDCPGDCPSGQPGCAAPAESASRGGAASPDVGGGGLSGAVPGGGEPSP